MELALRQVYGKMAQELGAHRLRVVRKVEQPSEQGIRFAIETALATAAGDTVVTGSHVVPLGKPYAIALLVVSRVGGVEAGREWLTRVLDSLRLSGERPLGASP